MMGLLLVVSGRAEERNKNVTRIDPEDLLYFYPGEFTQQLTVTRRYAVNAVRCQRRGCEDLSPDSTCWKSALNDPIAHAAQM